MKYYLAIIITFTVSALHAAPQIYCRTKKTEVDLTDRFYMATDSNQRINMELKDSIMNGKKVLINVDKQTLQYEFSQSSGGESLWSLTVSQVIVEGTDIKLSIKLKKARYEEFVGILKLKVFELGGESSAVMISNKKQLVRGRRVIYNMPDEEEDKYFYEYLDLAKQNKFKQGDLSWLLIMGCRLQ